MSSRAHRRWTIDEPALTPAAPRIARTHEAGSESAAAAMRTLIESGFQTERRGPRLPLWMGLTVAAGTSLSLWWGVLAAGRALLAH